jgi:hypothetical protein
MFTWCAPEWAVDPPAVPAIVDRRTGAVLMIVDDQAEAEIITVELRRRGVAADVVSLPKPTASDNVSR